MTCGFTAGDLANLCALAGDVALAAGRSAASTDDFADPLEACILAGAHPVLLEPDDRLQVAYEVAGRLIIAWRVLGVKPAGRTTILAATPSAGYEAAFKPDLRQNHLLAYVDLALAGAAAQELAAISLPYRGEPLARAEELAGLIWPHRERVPRLSRAWRRRW